MGFIETIEVGSLYKLYKGVQRFNIGQKVKVIRKQSGFSVGYIGTVTGFYIGRFAHAYELDNIDSVQVDFLSVIDDCISE